MNNPLWDSIEVQVRSERDRCGEDRVRTHMCTLIINCLRYSDPRSVSISEARLRHVVESIRVGHVNETDYARLKRLMRKAGFQNLPETDP